MRNRITQRQRWVWLASSVSAVAAILLCRLNWLWVLVGGSVVCLYYLYIEKKLDGRGLTEHMNGVTGKVCAVIMIFWFVLVMGYCACLADSAFPMVDGFPGLGWVLLALSAYGSRKGIRACAGCSGILCLFLFGLYALVAAFSLPDVQIEHLRPEGRWTQAISAAVAFLFPFGVWMMPVSRQTGKGRWWVLLLPVLAAALAAITAGVLSPQLARTVQVPLYELSRSVSVLGVVERIEPLLCAAMTMGLFCLLTSLACACQMLADRIENWKWSGSLCCLGAAGAMYAARVLPGGVWVVGNLLIFLLFPAVLVSFKKR